MLLRLILDIPKFRAYLVGQFGERKDEAFPSFSSEGGFYSPTSPRDRADCIEVRGVTRLRAALYVRQVQLCPLTVLGKNGLPLNKEYPRVGRLQVASAADRTVVSRQAAILYSELVEKLRWSTNKNELERHEAESRSTGVVE